MLDSKRTDHGDDTKEDASDKGQDSEKQHDVVFVHGRTRDGQGLRALRSRPERLETAEIRPVQSGQPLQPGSELIKLQQREESPLLYDVDVQFADGEHTGSRAGPPRVANSRYRDNWEVVFGNDTDGSAMEIETALPDRGDDPLPN